MKKVLALCMAASAFVVAPSVSAQRAVNRPAVTTSGDEAARRKAPPKTAPNGPVPQPPAPQRGIVRGREHTKAAEAAFALGVKFGRAGRFKEAVEAFEEAVLYNPSHADAHFNLGHALYDSGRWTEAAAAFRHAVALDPKDTEGFNYLGASYFRQGLYDKAIEAYKEAILVKPNLGDVRYNIANAFYKLGRYEPALLYYTEASYLRPKSAELLNDMGVAHAEWGRSAEAADFFKRALGQNADDPYAHNNLALTYYLRGDLQEAAKAFDRALRLAPQDAAIRRNAELASGTAQPGRVTALGDRVALRLDASGARRVVQWLGRSDVIYGVRDDRAPSRAGGVVDAAPRPHRKAPSIPAVLVLQTPAPAVLAAESAPPEPSVEVSEPPLPAVPPAAPPPTEVYRVGVGDVLDIRRLDETTKHSTLYTVLTGGLVEYPPLSQPFAVAGKTTDEIAAHIKSELQRLGVHDDARIVVGVRDYASHTIIVSGLVREAGPKLLRREAVPLYVVLADAQPLPEAGRVLVTSDAGARREELSLDDPATASRLVHPGDVINVLAKPQQFYFIGGKVDAAGQKEFHAGLTLTQAILAAGGSLHESKAALLTRQGEGGNLSTTKFSLKAITSGGAPDPLLRPGDRVEVIR